MKFFIYKSKYIEGIGGVLPPTKDLPKGVNLGLASYDNYYLGSCKDEYDVFPIKEYIVQYIDAETANGFKLLNTNVITMKNGKIRPLNEKEKQNKEKAKKLLLKLKMREKIYSNIGDIDDIIADLSKRIELLEYIIIYIIEKINIDKNEHIENIMNILNTKNITNFDNLEETLKKLSYRKNKLYEILEKEYKK